MAPQPSSDPVHVARGGGQMLWFLGQPLELKITRRHTGGAYAVTDAEPEPGFSPTPHAHENEDEAILVVEGEFLITVGDEQYRCGPGSLVHIPRGTTHTHENVGAGSGRTISIYTPAGFERIFEDLGEPLVDRAMGPSSPPEDPDEFLRRAEGYGLRY